ncbi:uncharacterized protein LACBIDRAFT_318033 [Laccaria bicolor S238N-H82]|uniref:Predicted protein n=1 Tax=Laccaria bicolor (strain S238N-H82 / ATCC MYA-4686) TaxID=486041 RepID=B0D5T8_LACBS|nr:uncharacterized protein LACBIDRAFT_318033 [Laccaria bicolor S238N-H82]EDR09830.1 predicted protein [Laccaria bicolor S238N-H82]|eukprot:XP_001879215.1 predicted protein [Laccaria bicolor S238N-H82]
MLQLRKLSAWITVDGKELHEYGAEISDDGKEATCWIPSKVGQHFAVNWKNTSRASRLPTSLGARLFLDGTEFSGGHMSEYPTTVTRIGVPSSNTTVKPFIFSKVELTDDDNFLAMPSGTGEIKILISEVTIKKNRRAVSYKAAVPELAQKVHERSKKGIVHGVSLANNIRRPKGTESYGGSVTKTRLRDLVTFVFKYRPLDILQANDIAPLPSKRKSLMMSKIEDQEEEQETLAETKQALQAALRRIEMLESSQKRKNNPEPALRRVKKARQDLEIIDLT